MFAMAIKSWGAGLVLAGEHRDVHVLASPNLKHQPAQERSQTSQTVQRCMRRVACKSTLRASFLSAPSTIYM